MKSNLTNFLLLLVILMSFGCSKDYGKLTRNQKGSSPAAITEKKEAISAVGLPKDLIGHGVLGGGFTRVTAKLSDNDPERGVLVGGALGERGQFTGAQCVTGTANDVSTSEGSVFGFEPIHPLIETRSDLLGFDLKSRAQFDNSLESKVAQILTENDLSDTMVYYVSSYNFGTQLLTDIKYTALGESLRGNKEEWNKVCGNSYVSQVRKEARFFAMLRIDYESNAQKLQMANVSRTGPKYENLFALLKVIKEASGTLDSKIKVTITAYQLGGDIAQLAGHFKNGMDVSCPANDISQCEDTANRLMKYAFDTKSGFPSQIADGVKPGPASIATVTDKYLE